MPGPAPKPSLFRSFWMAGYEASCHINRAGKRVDMIAVTQHDRFARQDYRLLREMGILTARDVVRWSLVDRGGQYDFSSFTPMLNAALDEGIQVIWDLCHYGWPEDVNLLSPEFVDRFARFSGAVARVVAEASGDVPFYTPVNEISFLAFAIGSKIFYPYVSGKDDEIKRQFVRAAMAAMDAVRAVDPRARFVTGEPLVHVIAPRGRPEMAEVAAAYREAQFSAWDMLAAEGYLDIVGVNYYHANQFELPCERLRWEDNPRDERMLALRELLAEAYERYGRPFFIGETSHFGVGRAPWLREIVEEAGAARCAGVPIEGICLYPIIDRPDWTDYSHWHNSGLWDLRAGRDGTLERELNPEYAAELRRAQAILPGRTGC